MHATMIGVCSHDPSDGAIGPRRAGNLRVEVVVGQFGE